MAPAARAVLLAWLIGFAAPGIAGPITDLSAANYQNGQTTLTFFQPTPNGSAVVGYQVSINGGGFTALATNRVVSGLSNGTSYTFTVEGCNVYCSSTPSNQATAVPDAPPSPPSLSVSTSGNTVNYTWGTPTSNGCPLQSASYSTNSGQGGSALSAGSTGNLTLSYSTTYTISATVTDSCGLTSTNSAQGTTGAAPPPPGPSVNSITKGALNTTAFGSCPIGGCNWIKASGSGYSSGVSYTWSCADNGAVYFSWSDINVKIKADANGNVTMGDHYCAEGQTGHTVTITIGTASGSYGW